MTAKSLLLGAFALLGVSSCEIGLPAYARASYPAEILVGAAQIVEAAHAAGARKSAAMVRAEVEAFMGRSGIVLPATFVNPKDETGLYREITVLRLEQVGNDLVVIYISVDTTGEQRFGLYTAGGTR